jgi:3D (Asp-Asp-Asp) domain-containing protein
MTYLKIRLKGSILGKLNEILFVLLIILATYDTAAANQLKSSLLIYNDQQYIVESETIRIVTAYNAGDPNQTDDTPCVSADGENLCRALAKGEKRCAANFVPLGTSLHVDKFGVCVVTDRTNKRYRNRVDIAMQKDEYDKARRFGRQKLHVRILVNKQPATIRLVLKEVKILMPPIISMTSSDGRLIIHDGGPIGPIT